MKYDISNAVLKYQHNQQIEITQSSRSLPISKICFYNIFSSISGVNGVLVISSNCRETDNEMMTDINYFQAYAIDFKDISRITSDIKVMQDYLDKLIPSYSFTHCLSWVRDLYLGRLFHSTPNG